MLERKVSPDRKDIKFVSLIVRSLEVQTEEWSAMAVSGGGVAGKWYPRALYQAFSNAWSSKRCKGVPRDSYARRRLGPGRAGVAGSWCNDSGDTRTVGPAFRVKAQSQWYLDVTASVSSFVFRYWWSPGPTRSPILRVLQFSFVESGHFQKSFNSFPMGLRTTEFNYKLVL